MRTGARSSYGRTDPKRSDCASCRKVASPWSSSGAIPPASSRAPSKGSLPLRYRLEVTYPGGSTFELDDPYTFLPTLGELDVHLAAEGLHERLYEKLGAHVREVDGVGGTAFAVWAPNARSVSVVGDFNNWDGRLHQMRTLGAAGIWELFLPGVEEGARYKFDLRYQDGSFHLRADPYALATEHPPQTASVVWTSGHGWDDGDWLERRRSSDPLRGPISIYEVHLGSWRQGLSYRELAEQLGGYVRDLGLHARRADAGDGAPLRRLVGLPGDELLRADLALRHAGRLPLPRRLAAPAGDRRHPRLGAGALPARRLGARALRRHGAVRARRPAPRRASRLGHARLQPRPQRGSELPARERPALAGGVPRRRPARGRGRLDALPRLLAQGRRVDPERPRRPREPRLDRVPARAERGRPRAGARA